MVSILLQLGPDFVADDVVSEGEHAAVGLPETVSMINRCVYIALCNVRGAG